MAKQFKTDIKYSITLDDEQKNVKKSIFENQIVIVTGRAGSVTRANVETGRSLGFLPGTLDEKFNPYLEAFKENLMTSYSDTKEKKEKLEQHIKNKDIDALPIAFIRGKTINDILIVEESQNLLVSEVSSIASRLGKNGRIVFNGDFDQVDTKESYTGLHYLMDMANALEDIKVHKLKHNHRSDLVGKILDWEYSRNKKV